MLCALFLIVVDIIIYWHINFICISCTHTDPTSLTSNLIVLERSHGASPEYLLSLPMKISLVLQQRGVLAKKLKQLATHFLSPLRPTPVIANDAIAWAEKNTAFAAQTLLLAAAANDLCAVPMEGFDERRLSTYLSLSTHLFSIPFVVAVGYPLEAVEKEGEKEVIHQPRKHKIRFAVNDMCFSEVYGATLNDSLSASPSTSTTTSTTPSSTSSSFTSSITSTTSSTTTETQSPTTTTPAPVEYDEENGMTAFMFLFFSVSLFLSLSSS